jgi:membrane fusion protein (multidrug efflux system)
MTKRYFVVPFMILVLAACGGNSTKDAATRLGQLKKQKATLEEEIAKLEKEVSKNDTTVKEKVKTVALTPVENTLFEHFIDVQGSVDARENVNVTSKVPGVITAIYVKEGQMVKEGQALAQVDDQVLRSGIAELKTQLELATVLYEKQKNLWAQKIGSEVQYLSAKNNKESLERKMATLQDQVGQTRIISPISGSVDAVIAKIGDAAQPGAPAFRVVNSNNLKVVANVAESYAGKIKTGDEVVVAFPDINKEIRTRVTFASRVIDPVSRTIKVEVALKPDAALRPNMIARIRIIDYTAKNAVVIPVNVIQYSMGKPFVVVAKEVNGKQTAQRRTLELGHTYNDMAEVTSGLQAGDKIVSMGYQGLDDNDLIKL